MRTLALLVVTVGGCGGAPAGVPAVEVGTGQETFIALGDGDAVPIIHGLQGGYHVWGAARASNLAASQLHLVFTLARVDGAAPSSTRTEVVDLVGGEHLGTAVFVPEPDRVRGQ